MAATTTMTMARRSCSPLVSCLVSWLVCFGFCFSLRDTVDVCVPDGACVRLVSQQQQQQADAVASLSLLALAMIVCPLLMCVQGLLLDLILSPSASAATAAFMCLLQRRVSWTLSCVSSLVSLIRCSKTRFLFLSHRTTLTIVFFVVGAVVVGRGSH